MGNIERLRLAVDALRCKYHYDPETGLFHNRSTGKVMKGSLYGRHRGTLERNYQIVKRSPDLYGLSTRRLVMVLWRL